MGILKLPKKFKAGDQVYIRVPEDSGDVIKKAVVTCIIPFPITTYHLRTTTDEVYTTCRVEEIFKTQQEAEESKHA